MTVAPGSLSIELVALDAVYPNPHNARRHSAKQVDQLSASIEELGFRVPLIVAEDGMILAGHGRWEAARKVGLTEIPVIRDSSMNEEQRRAFALADNRLAELSEWNDDILSKELKILFDGGFELQLTGFSTADLDFSLARDNEPTAEDDVPLPELVGAVVSKLGDLWEIGPHRMKCGDACHPIVWEDLLGDERAVLVFGDLPYNVKIDGHVSGNGRHRHREFAMASGEMTSSGYTAFLRRIFRNCVRFSTDGSIHYQCIDWRHTPEILDAGNGVYDEFKQLVVWSKTNAGQGAFYRSQHELIFVFKAGRGKHINNFGMGQKRYRTNVVTYAGANSFHHGRDEDLEAHPTVKPTALVADFLLDCSNRGDLVVDPTFGSGTSLVAAHRTGRRGYGIELDPLYVDTALRRLMSASGLTATLVGDGRTFEEVAAERAPRVED
jgi:DNA modification methylase